MAKDLDLQKHLNTPARRLPAGEARKVCAGLGFLPGAKPALSSLSVARRKLSSWLRDTLGSWHGCQGEQNMLLGVVKVFHLGLKAKIQC